MKGFLAESSLSKAVYLGAAGCLIIIFSVYFALVGFPNYLNNQIKEKIALNNGTQGMKAWEVLPLPIEFKIYVFNVTNPDEVSEGKQPIVEELGPYVYDQYRKKVDVDFTEDDTVSYRLEKKFYFNKNKSGCHKESDIVVVPNIPLIGIAYTVEEKFPVGMNFVNTSAYIIFPGIKDIFMTVSVGDLLFRGVRIKCNHKTGPAMPICEGIRRNPPKSFRKIPNSRDFYFSYFEDANSTLSGMFKVKRGNQNSYDLGRIVEYDNHTYLTMWDRNTTCSKIKGTDSTIIAPIQAKNDIFIFLPEVCLSLNAVFEKKINIYGIEVYQYYASRHNFDSEKIKPDNICRCKKDEDKPEAPPICLKTGAIDAYKCQGAPITFTYPHMLFADPEYQNYVKGYLRDEKKHQTQVFIEPRTGVPLAAFKRIQMNIYLKQLKEVDMFANVSQGLFPLVWIEEALTEELIQTYLPGLNEMMNIIRIIMSITGILAGVGALCLLISLVLYLKYRKISCMKENQVVSNISTVGLGNMIIKETETNDKTMQFRT